MSMAISEDAILDALRRVAGIERSEPPAGEAHGLTEVAQSVNRGLAALDPSHPSSRILVTQLLREEYGMKESVTYQAIVEEGKVLALQDILLQLGRKRFGPPSEQTERTVRAIVVLNRLEQLCDRLLEASSWQELLSTP